MPLIEHKIFDEAYLRSDQGHFSKLKRRNCENEFELWRAAKRELDNEYKNFNSVIGEIANIESSEKEQQNKLLDNLKRAINSFSMCLYAYTEKTKFFLNNYLGNNLLDQSLFESIIRSLFWTIPFRIFIQLHNCYKHSGTFGLLAFDIQNRGKDFYIITRSVKPEDEYIARLLDGADIVYYIEKAVQYVNDAEADIFHHIVRRS